MLTRIARTSRVAVSRRVANSRRAASGIANSGTIFEDREHALENRAARDNDARMIEQLRAELAAKDSALKKAQDQARKGTNDADDEEIEYLNARQRKLQRKLLDIQEELDEIRSKLKK